MEIVKFIEIYHENEIDRQKMISYLENKESMKNELESKKQEKNKDIVQLQKELKDKNDFFDCYTVSLAKNLFERQSSFQHENFLALQKVYGTKVIKK